MTQHRRPRSSQLRRKPSGRPLDTIAREALKRCAGVVARCGYSPMEAAHYFGEACQRIPRSVVERGAGIQDLMDLAAHVLTLWRQERGYVMSNGDPRPLPLRGAAPSVQALVRKVGGGLTIEAARAQLLSTRSLRRVGSRYVPRVLEVAWPSNSRSQQAHHMRVLVDLLRTVEHNTLVRRDDERWFQYKAENPCVPIDQLLAFTARLRRAGRAFLNDQDVLMYRLARRGRKATRAKAVSVAVFLSQSPPRPSESRAPAVRRSPLRPGRPR